MIVILCLFAGAFFSFLMDEEDEQRRGKGVDRRVAVERMMEAYNLRFSKEVAQTSIIFQFTPGDSVRIKCNICPQLVGTEEETKGMLGISLQSLDGTQKLGRNSFNKWIKVKSSNGKFGIIFERDGLGEKLLTVDTMVVWRKTRKPATDEAGVPASVVDVNNLYIDKMTKDNTLEQTTFYFRLKSEDQVLVDIKGANGAVPENLVCQVYKEKEEFDKTPIKTATLIPVPKVDGGADRFAFEFSHIKDVKGVNTYHIDIWRTPARSTGYLDQPPPVVDTTDSVIVPADTILPQNGENDLFLAYLAKLAGGPTFQCVTPELEVAQSINGSLVLGMTKRSKFCVDLPLSDECVASDECVGCDTLWSFWIGAGQDLINRYRFADSLRKMSKAAIGLLESYARSKKYRGMQGGSIFPTQQFGEDIYFVILDTYEKQRFLGTDLGSDEAMQSWVGDGIYTFSPGAYVSSNQYMLKYNPARPMSLCVCNNNSVSTVPFLFKFQQYLTEPKPVDSAALLLPIDEGGDEGIYEYEDEEAAPVREAPKEPVDDEPDEESLSEE